MEISEWTEPALMGANLTVIVQEPFVGRIVSEQFSGPTKKPPTRSTLEIWTFSCVRFVMVIWRGLLTALEGTPPKLKKAGEMSTLWDEVSTLTVTGTRTCFCSCPSL